MTNKGKSMPTSTWPTPKRIHFPNLVPPFRIEIKVVRVKRSKEWHIFSVFRKKTWIRDFTET
jgi:hypothetical protein